MKTLIANEERLSQKRIRLQIPKHYHQEPVISRLVSVYSLTVTITAAVLGGNGNGDGWFDLNLGGTTVQIESALTYLNDLNLTVWHGAEVDGW